MLVVLVITLAVFPIYGALMVWLYFGVQETKSAKQFTSDSPLVSIIVALRDENKNVNSLLKGLIAQNYPNEKLEIILVNDNSNDNTLELLKAFESSTVKVFNNTGNGKKQAIETGVRNATGEWILVTDADCEIPSSWVVSMLGRITPKSKMVLGPVFIKNADSFLEQLQSIEFLGLQGTTCGSAGMGYPISANAANMLFQKDVFEELNPYQDNYHLKTGDDQFLLMAVTNKYPQSVIYSLDEGSIIFTHPVKTWKKYFDQRIRWASKGSSYSQELPKMVGLLVVAISLIILVDWNIGFQDENLKLAFLPILAKMALDLFVIFPMKRFSGVKVNPIYYPISTIVYAFVVVFTVIAGFFRK